MEYVLTISNDHFGPPATNPAVCWHRLCVSALTLHTTDSEVRTIWRHHFVRQPLQPRDVHHLVLHSLRLGSREPPTPAAPSCLTRPPPGGDGVQETRWQAPRGVHHRSSRSQGNTCPPTHVCTMLSLRTSGHDAPAVCAGGDCVPQGHPHTRAQLRRRWCHVSPRPTLLCGHPLQTEAPLRRPP